MNQPNPQFGSSNTTGRSTTITATGPIAQILSILIFLVLIVVGFVLGFIILIPIAILALILFVYFKIKAALARTHAPNGPLDGRHNVRVIDRDE